MKLDDFRNHFISRADWVDADETVDNIVIGDPNAAVSNCAVTWISSFVAVREAVERNLDLLITHEPTFYGHTQNSETAYQKETGYGAEKRKFIEDNGLAILRLHDTWDRWPDIGIPWSWARFLQLSGPPATTNEGDRPPTQLRYDIEPTTLGEFANHVASRTAAIGEGHPVAYGELEWTVSKVGVGTGCICDIDVFRELGCDLSVVCDDAISHTRDIQWAVDEGHSVIRVNHGTSEEAGMKSLADYIENKVEGVAAEYLPVFREFHQV